MNVNQNSGFMPAEESDHLRTWMAFDVNQSWGRRYLAETQKNIADVALTIAKYEPVTMLVSKENYATAQKFMGSEVELIIHPLDDVWMRDTGPVFVFDQQNRKAAIDFNFNGWGNKQKHDRDAKVASFIIEKSGAELIQTRLVLEGGAIVVDGDGTAIFTESCIINSNRNLGINKTECEDELKRLLGLEKIIWLPGIKEQDITDGHTDGYVKFVKPGVVVAGYESNPSSYDYPITQCHLDILRKAIDAKGRKLNITILESPRTIRKKYVSDDFFASYINYYVCNGAVIMPEFGDEKADRAAADKLKQLYPERDIVMINIDAIAIGGGGIHCLTQQEPRF